MTKDKFDKLENGTMVWYAPAYFSFPMLGVIKTMDGEKGVWVNFYGDGQCFFAPEEGYEERFLDNVSVYDKQE